MKFFGKVTKKVKRVVGAEEVKENTNFILNFARACHQQLGLNGEKSAERKTFSEAGYTKLQLSKAKETFKKYFFFYAVVTILSLLYIIYALVHADYRLAILATLFFVLCLAQAFRYHFWLFQIKQGRLGCTFEEWLKALLGSGV